MSSSIALRAHTRVVVDSINAAASIKAGKLVTVVDIGLAGLTGVTRLTDAIEGTITIYAGSVVHTRHSLTFIDINLTQSTREA